MGPEKEADAQKRWFAWAGTVRIGEYAGRVRTLADFSFAVPNGAMLAGPVAQRARYVNFLKAQGLKPGVSDIVIALPRGSFHGAYMELKREAGSRTSDAQEDWVALMNAVGYHSAIVKGYEEARQFAQDYLKCA